MDDILAARSQMAMSLAFHIIFAVIGIGMPLLMVIAEWCSSTVRCYTKSGDCQSLRSARRKKQSFAQPIFSASAPNF